MHFSKDTKQGAKEPSKSTIAREVSEYSRARQSLREKEALLQGEAAGEIVGLINQEVAQPGEKGDIEYKVTVVTGDIKKAGTDAAIFIIVVGDEGATKRQPLDSWYNDFERGDNKDYFFEDIDVGRIEYIIIKMEASSFNPGDDEWFLERVEVTKTGDTRRFPHNQWVSPKDGDFFFIQCELTRLPLDDSRKGRVARSAQAEQLKKLYPWCTLIPQENGDPEDMKGIIPAFLKVPDKGGYDNLEDKYKWYVERYEEYKKLRNDLFSVGIMETIKGFFDPISDLEEFKEVTEAARSSGFLGFGGPEKTDEDCWIYRWREDTEFGRQTLNGMNPVMVKQIREMPEKFPVTDSHLHWPEGSLKAELDAGKMFMVDYKILEGIPTGEYDGKKLELAPAMGLFYQDQEDNFLPVAIQLGQTHDKEACPIWTPKDSPEDWLLAKMWFRNADAQVLSEEYLCHIIMVSVFRCPRSPPTLHTLTSSWSRLPLACSAVSCPPTPSTRCSRST